MRRTAITKSIKRKPKSPVQSDYCTELFTLKIIFQNLKPTYHRLEHEAVHLMMAASLDQCGTSLSKP